MRRICRVSDVSCAARVNAKLLGFRGRLAGGFPEQPDGSVLMANIYRPISHAVRSGPFEPMAAGSVGTAQGIEAATSLFLYEGGNQSREFVRFQLTACPHPTSRTKSMTLSVDSEKGAISYSWSLWVGSLFFARQRAPFITFCNQLTCG